MQCLYIQKYDKFIKYCEYPEMHLRYPSLLSQKSFYVNILAFQQHTLVVVVTMFSLSATEKKLVERILRRVFH